MTYCAAVMSNEEVFRFSNPLASVSRYRSFSALRSKTGAKSEFARTVATNGESAFESARCSAASDTGVSDVTLLRSAATSGHSVTRQSGLGTVAAVVAITTMSVSSVR